MSNYVKQGKKVGITFSNVEDAVFLEQWFSEEGIRKALCFDEKNTSRCEEEKYIISNSKYTFTIYDIERTMPIGFMSAFDVNIFHHTCEIGICIGNQEYRRKGYAYEATYLLLTYLFSSISMNSIIIRINANNTCGIRLAEKLGFSLIGVHRNAIMSERNSINELLYDMTFEDYERSNEP